MQVNDDDDDNDDFDIGQVSQNSCDSEMEQELTDTDSLILYIAKKSKVVLLMSTLHCDGNTGMKTLTK